jgi:glyoxylase-like metal-dependent hydrolase (beta-lactamase superfamily II)
MKLTKLRVRIGSCLRFGSCTNRCRGFDIHSGNSGTNAPNRNNGRKTGDEVASGIRVLATPGHTPGHISLEIAGGDGLIVVGDVVANAAVSFAHPEWRFAIDTIPELAIQTRRRLLDRAATDRARLLGSHWPYPGLGMAERRDGAYRFVATG